MISLERYKFRDELGHPLENCVEYLEVLRLAELGATVEAMPPDAVLEREGWCDAAWNARKNKVESALKGTPKEALEDLYAKLS